MPKQSKPSIVFAHGLWADGSCFQKLIPTLQAEGHEVMASQGASQGGGRQHGISCVQFYTDAIGILPEIDASGSYGVTEFLAEGFLAGERKRPCTSNQHPVSIPTR